MRAFAHRSGGNVCREEVKQSAVAGCWVGVNEKSGSAADPHVGIAASRSGIGLQTGLRGNARAARRPMRYQRPNKSRAMISFMISEVPA